MAHQKDLRLRSIFGTPSLSCVLTMADTPAYLQQLDAVALGDVGPKRTKARTRPMRSNLPDLFHMLFYWLVFRSDCKGSIAIHQGVVKNSTSQVSCRGSFASRLAEVEAQPEVESQQKASCCL